MTIDLFIGTVFSEDLDGNPSPASRPRHLRPFNADYVVTQQCLRVVHAATAAAAEAALRLELANLTDDATDDAYAATIQAGAVHEQSQPNLADLFKQQEPWRNSVRDSLEEGIDELLSAVAAEPSADDDASAEAPAAQQQAFDVRYTISASCQRRIWARDADHAATILAEDVSVLLNTDCLDRWTDECDAVTSELVSTDAHVPTEASE